MKLFKSTFLIKTIFVLFSIIVHHVSAQKIDFNFDDKVYDENIKSVFIYPTSSQPNRSARLLEQPIIQLQGNQTLTLEFDDLEGQFQNYRVKIYHCNADWTKSALSEVEYTFEYNDYPITEYEQSFATKIPYYHFTFLVPKVKVSGNYLITVYNERSKKTVLSRKFLVYDPRVRVEGKVGFSSGITEQKTHQQLDFELEHRGYPINSPQTELTLVLRQNYQWRTAKKDLKPSTINPFDNKINYQFFKLENNFPGGNEYRYFDSRTTLGRGFGINQIERGEDYTTLILAPDSPRANQGYFQFDDFNGYQIVDHRESGNGNTEADYNFVVFSLKAPETNDYNIYVNGSFNNWQLDDMNRMEYNEEHQVYNSMIWIKQGVTNFNYVVQYPNGKINDTLLEGTYSATENVYDVLIYHRPPAARTDMLVGYKTFEWNKRN